MSRVRNLKRASLAFLKLFRDPKSTENVMELVDSLCDLGLFRWSMRKLQADPLTSEVLGRRPRIPELCVADLLDLPEGSLGKVMGLTLNENGFDPNYFRKRVPRTTELYIIVRAAECHDLWHAATGFDTSIPGEIALQTFMFRQLRTPHSPVLIGGAILRCLILDWKNLFAVSASIIRGWQLAVRIRPLFSVDWMSHLSQPIEDFRAGLAIQVNSTQQAFWVTR